MYAYVYTYVTAKANGRKAEPRDQTEKRQRGSLLTWDEIRKMFDCIVFLQLIDSVASWYQYIHHYITHHRHALTRVRDNEYILSGYR